MVLLNTASKVYTGGSLASKVYAGAVQVWPPPPSGGGPEVIRATTGSGVVAGTTGIVVNTGAMVAGDVVLVISCHTNDTAHMATPTATGLTFTEVHASPDAGVSSGVYVATAPDATSRAVAIKDTSGFTSVVYGAVIVVRGITTTASPAGGWATFTATTTPNAASVTASAAGLAFAYMVASAYPSYANNPTVTQAGWAQVASFRQDQWGGVCVAAKGVGTGATGTVAFSQSPSAPGLSGSFALASL